MEIDRDEEDDRGRNSMLFIVWSIFAGIGVMWLMNKVHWFANKVQQFFGQERGRDIRVALAGLLALTIDLSVERRGVSCMSMSTWLCGAMDRYSPTRECDQGAFVSGLSVTVDREIIAQYRDIDPTVV